MVATRPARWAAWRTFQADASSRNPPAMNRLLSTCKELRCGSPFHPSKAFHRCSVLWESRSRLGYREVSHPESKERQSRAVLGLVKLKAKPGVVGPPRLVVTPLPRAVATLMTPVAKQVQERTGEQQEEREPAEEVRAVLG